MTGSPVLVLVTHREDLTADLVVAELRRRDASFFRLNTEDYPTRAALRWTAENAQLRIHDRDVDASDISAVWWRRPVIPQLPSDLSPDEARWAAGEAQAALEGFWRSVNAHWVNVPSANAAADCKPEQLQRAETVGFDVPASLVTNEAAAMMAFVDDHQKVVCKSLREGVVARGDGSAIFYTELVDAADPSWARDLGPEPYLFQELVAKRYDVRVTVIGDQAFACRIERPTEDDASIDWRKEPIERLRHEVEGLPADVTDRCIALTRSYGLRFAAIDLARQADGTFAFFELNPNGQWGWIEQLTGLPLSRHLCDELLQERA